MSEPIGCPICGGYAGHNRNCSLNQPFFTETPTVQRELRASGTRDDDHTMNEPNTTPSLDMLPCYLIGDLGPARRHIQRLIEGESPCQQMFVEIQNSLIRCVRRIERDWSMVDALNPLSQVPEPAESSSAERVSNNYHPKASLDTYPGEGAAKQSGKASSTLCEVGIGAKASTNPGSDRTSQTRPLSSPSPDGLKPEKAAPTAKEFPSSEAIEAANRIKNELLLTPDFGTDRAAEIIQVAIDEVLYRYTPAPPPSPWIRTAEESLKEPKATESHPPAADR